MYKLTFTLHYQSGIMAHGVSGWIFLLFSAVVAAAAAVFFLVIVYVLH